MYGRQGSSRCERGKCRCECETDSLNGECTGTRNADVKYGLYRYKPGMGRLITEYAYYKSQTRKENQTDTLVNLMFVYQLFCLKALARSNSFILITLGFPIFHYSKDIQ